MILDKAKKLANKERKIKEDEHKKEKEEQRHKAKELSDQTNDLLAYLRKELHNKGGFSVFDAKSVPHLHYPGDIAYLYKDKELVGRFYCKWESYQFRGSDEVPEETCWHIVMGFKEDGYREPYLDNYRWNYDKYRTAFAATNLEEFEESLAEFLKKYY